MLPDKIRLGVCSYETDKKRTDGDSDQTLYSGIAANNGFTAITVAWLSQLNPFGMVLIALLLASLSKGSSSLKTAMGVPGSISDIITGIILLCLLGCEFFINYRLVFRHKEDKNA